MKKATVLVVDDDNISLALISKLLENLDLNVLRAHDGVEGLVVMNQQPVDLIVADYEMPRMDGLEFLKAVKGEHPTTPFILITAYSNLKVIREAWESGAFDFFQKPVFVDRLNQTVKLAIEYGHLSIARRKFINLESVPQEPDLVDQGVARELALALEASDLKNILEEFHTHSRIELEQILRFSLVGQAEYVRNVAHRLRGTSMNLGLIKFGKVLTDIEQHPEVPIQRPVDLEQLLERSIFWLNDFITHLNDRHQSRAS